MIEQWSVGVADANMDEQMLVRLAGDIERHPWWRARARLTLALLRREGVWPPASVLDAGCGWGVTLRTLEDAGYRAAGLDISRRALDRLEGPARRLIAADLVQPLPDGHPLFDAVLALDVIEHIDADGAAVANLGRLVRPGGLIVVSVPALQELYSEFDEVQGHRRRYDAATLVRVFEGTGLEVTSTLWWGRSFVPLLWLQRRRRKRRDGDTPDEVYERYVKAPRGLARLVLDTLMSWEVAGTLGGRTGVGTSLFAIARRRT